MISFLRVFSILCFSISALPAFCQGKYWITFTDKDTAGYHYQDQLSPRAIRNRQILHVPLWQYSDIPLNTVYIDSLSGMGISFTARSRWLNSVSARLNEEQIASLKKIAFIQDIEPVNSSIKVTSVNTDLETKEYSLTLEQMQAKSFVDAGLSGKGVLVGVIDAGFFSADREPRLIHLFDEKKILKQRDFIDSGRTDLVTDAATNSDDHGKKVLEYLCGYYISEKFQSGLAVNARFCLARTENGDREHRGEEDDWIMAMEWMDSLGVRLINTSLGYATNMDDPADNYTLDEMNGKTARITRAADIAVNEKGLFLVVSAGNEGGNKNWEIISAPADARGVLSVGATDANQPSKIWYSSIGPEFLPYLKPNVSCYSPNGTSFSAPALTGFVACIMEKDSSLSNKQIKEIVEKSSHLYPFGNNYIGYGIPQADRVLTLLKGETPVRNAHQLQTDKDRVHIIFKTKDRKGEAVLFHKKDSRNVIRQEVVPVKRRRITLERKEGEKVTTLNFEDEVIEVVWE